jgi:hypothetical protein
VAWEAETPALVAHCHLLNLPPEQVRRALNDCAHAIAASDTLRTMEVLPGRSPVAADPASAAVRPGTAPII